MKRILKGVGFGAIAGVVDVIPMFLQKLSLDANLSAFSMWLVIGFFLSVSDLKMKGVIKGIMFSFLALLPAGIIIGWKEPFSLIPISIMTLILGSLLGICIDKFVLNNK